MNRTGSFHSNEGESSQPVAVGFQRENSSPKIISLEGCSRSEAFQLLSDRTYSEFKYLIILWLLFLISLSASSLINYGSLAFTSISFYSTRYKCS